MTQVQEVVGVLVTLQREHRELSSLMNVLLDGARGTDAPSIDRRRTLFARVRIGLLAHAEAEQETLYDRLRALAASCDRSTHSTAEHLEIDHVLRRLDMLGFADAGWLPTFATLQMKVEHHVHEEEDTLFALATRLLGEVTLRAIERDYIEARLRSEALLGRRPRRRIGSVSATA